MSDAGSAQPRELRELHLHSPSAPAPPAFAGPPVACLHGAHLLELVVGTEGGPRHITETLAIVW